LPPEPLVLSAPVALQAAGQMCRIDRHTGERCDWSHGIWQYLRLLGLVGSLDYHTDFYRESLARVLGPEPQPKVLISGAADYGLLARVIWAFRSRGVEPGITVLDLCETPLYLNRWYAARVSCPITTLACDIHAFAPDAPFDAICADSFLGRFAPARRAALIAKWRDLLLPGGRVIAVNRIRAANGTHDAGTGQLPVRFSPGQVAAFSDEVRRAAHRMFDANARPTATNEATGNVVHDVAAPFVDAEELARMAETYAHRHQTWPVSSLGEITALFEAGGFRIDHAALSTTPDGIPELPGAPSVRGSATFAHIIAVRN